jgi:calcineurin-like phosphoesterase family protein
MGKLWFTSDTHFGHFNIIEYTKRPFKSLYHMDTDLIRRWNERVKPEDSVIFVGDFCFRNSKGGKEGEGTTNRAEYYLSQLNGKVTIVNGNHDWNNGVDSCIKSLVLHYGGGEIFVCHEPEDAVVGYPLYLCGHVHNHWKIKKFGSVPMVNVGVDVWNYYPVSLPEIMKAIKEGD